MIFCFPMLKWRKKIWMWASLRSCVCSLDVKVNPCIFKQLLFKNPYWTIKEIPSSCSKESYVNFRSRDPFVIIRTGMECIYNSELCRIEQLPHEHGTITPEILSFLQMQWMIMLSLISWPIKEFWGKGPQQWHPYQSGGTTYQGHASLIGLCLFRTWWRGDWEPLLLQKSASYEFRHSCVLRRPVLAMNLCYEQSFFYWKLTSGGGPNARERIRLVKAHYSSAFWWSLEVLLLNCWRFLSVKSKAVFVYAEQNSHSK